MILLAQCLCPQRHCILAATHPDDGTDLVQYLKNQLLALIRGNQIDPWCGICGAKAREWKYEVATTPFATMEEALPVIAQEQAKQLATLEHLKRTGQAYTSPLRN